ncbi:hypothetical protein [Amycolatopsis taiwanensis]|uniref:ClpX-type ZB domain-containing protein n=1 Tax=Amycolatopsis taiwanensis TaxID=342230 RepID=A0A9W6R2V1_9PSEU|nr:hypothetical protein [Amycolatopsis taiwanensis]GLY66567.1 hypothetical protein Atai01_31860 [Amycolatopsis taiwanensis]
MRTNQSPCRFCDRPPRPGQYRAPGPRGPICVDCLEAGLQLVHDGQARVSLGGTHLALAASPGEQACEFCGRSERRSFLGLRRALARMSCPQRGSVICADCLDRGGDLLNRVARERTK